MDATFTPTEALLLAMALVFSVPYLVWRLARTDYFAPLVVVQILCGILLGPGVLGRWFPDYFHLVFPPAVIGSMNGIACWAVMLFVCLAGVELDLEQAWKHRAEAGTAAGLALIMPLVLGSLVALYAWREPGWRGAAATEWQFVLGVGMACAVTALPILILLMEKLDILRTPLGQRILRYASLDDIAIWGVLATILMDWDRVLRQVGFLLAFIGLSACYRAVMRRLPPADRWYAALIWLLACGWGADVAGLHYMVGAFLAGTVMDLKWFNVEDLDRMRGNVLLVLMPVFFLSTGLRTNWALGGTAVCALALVLLVASVAGKLLAIHLVAWLQRWPAGEARVVGWLLQTKALIMIIFVNVLLDRDIIASGMFTALLLMAVMSTMLAIPFAAPALTRAQAAVRRDCA